MPTLMSTLAVLASFLAIFCYQWVTFMPRHGLLVLYHMRSVRILVALGSLSLALGAYLLNGSTAQLAALIATIALTLLSGQNYGKYYLPAMDNPGYAAAGEADLGDQAQVIGLALDGRARAWPLEILVPHHLINDSFGSSPVLPAW